MPKKRYSPEEIVARLRQVDVLVGQGKPIGEAVKTIGVTETTYHRWRREYGGLKLDQPGKAAEGAGGGELPAAPRGVGFDLGQDDPE